MLELEGGHRLKHGDFIRGIDDLMNGEKADIVFVDGPWSDKGLRYWESRPGAFKTGHTIDIFHYAMFETALRYGKGVFICSTGIEPRHTKFYARNKPYPNEMKFESLYVWDGHKPYKKNYHVFTMDKLSIDKVKAVLDGVNTYDGIEGIIRPFAVEDGIVLDFCCGSGRTAKAVKALNMRLYGCDINKFSLEQTREVLECK